MPVLEKNSWIDETMINLYQNDGKRRVWRRKGMVHYGNPTSLSVKHDGSNPMAWACMAAKGPGSLVFMDDVIVDRSKGGNSEGKEIEYFFNDQVSQLRDIYNNACNS